jgi:DNA-binding response OmpR family regulator
MPQLMIEEPLPWSGGHVVVVDDNVASAHMLADFLRMIGHGAEVVTGSTIDAIVDAVVAVQPDIVFLDIMLGQLDGHAVAHALRERGCDAYLVAVTGWGEPGAAAHSLTIGFDEHWAKPLDTNRVELFMRERPERRVAALSLQ